MMIHRRNLGRLIPAALYYAAIFYLSSRNFQVRAGFPFFDKFIHGFLFAGFGFVLAYGFITTFPALPARLKTLLPAVGGMAMAALDELHQYFVPGRHCDIVDFLADSAGVIAGIWFFRFLQRRKRNRENEKPLSLEKGTTRN